MCMHDYERVCLCMLECEPVCVCMIEYERVCVCMLEYERVCVCFCVFVSVSVFVTHTGTDPMTLSIGVTLEEISIGLGRCGRGEGRPRSH